MHLLVTGPLSDVKSLTAELGRMNIHISPDILSQIIELDPHNEILINAKENLKEEPVPQKNISVIIDNAKMVASVCINKDYGLPLSIHDLEMELKAAGVIFGIKRKRWRKLYKIRESKLSWPMAMRRLMARIRL